MSAGEAERDHSVTTIDGWVPVGTHLLLQRAAEIAAAHRHPYLGTEHLAAAITESRLVTAADGEVVNIGSRLTQVWPDGGRRAITLDELHELILAAMPDTGTFPCWRSGSCPRRPRPSTPNTTARMPRRSVPSSRVRHEVQPCAFPLTPAPAFRPLLDDR